MSSSGYSPPPVGGYGGRSNAIVMSTSNGNDGYIRPNISNNNNNAVSSPSSVSVSNTQAKGEMMRHGFEEEYSSEAYLSLLAQIFYIYFDDKRHETGGNPKPPSDSDPKLPEWRMKDRQKTVSAAIVLCLNIGVDPPDVVKTHPCAKLEAWVDPSAFNDPKKVTEQIGKQLQTQYETLSLRTRYKQSLDPNVEDAKRFCIALRRGAKEERILFHYNGHGVPKPTPSGEIWVFNRGYTQYIPVSVYDLQTWLGAPCLFVYDCHAAGNIVSNFNRFVQKRIKDDEERVAKDTSSNSSPVFSGRAYSECIQLAACGANETLPMNPDLPADLFTCCLTCPVDIAVRWFVLQSALPLDLGPNITIPGRLADRRTPLGELNWIFTAITDTIAWSLLPRPLFKRLFRQDLMVAALFRNFLLAERIMRVHNCHPISEPPLPQTYDHTMWKSWDLAVDQCLAQLPQMIAAEKNGGIPYEYKHSTFFEEQLTAFEVWLKFGSSTKTPPEQLPVVLQVLLSQVHRLRALILLSKFLDLGPWAVYLALSIGIFPYVLKLLQSPAQELKPVLVFIWARIMSIDYKSIQPELLKDNGYTYFIQILAPRDSFPVHNINMAEHRAMCAFILALFCKGFKPAQRACMGPDVLKSCLCHVNEKDSPLLRQWACLCISQLWDENVEAKVQGVQENAPNLIAGLLQDPIPEVRTACLVALTTFLGLNGNQVTTSTANSSPITPNGNKSNNINSSVQDDLPADLESQETGIVVSVLGAATDGSAMVRREVVVFFSRLIKQRSSKFLVTAFNSLEYEVWLQKNPALAMAQQAKQISYGTVYLGVWNALLTLSADPYPEVANFASDVVDWVFNMLVLSPLAPVGEKLISTLLHRSGGPPSSSPTDDQQKDQIGGLDRNQARSTLSGASSTGRDGNRPMSAVSGLSLYANGPSANGNSSSLRIPKRSDEAINNSSSSSSSTGLANSLLRRSVSFATSIKNMYFADSEASGVANGGRHQPNRPPQALYDKPSVSTIPYGSGLRPVSSRYKKRPSNRPIILPLKSGFFDWSCEYFQEPQMSHPEMDEPGSLDYNERLWRRNRNERIIAETQPQKELAVIGSWNTGGFFNNISQPSKLVFAQFEPHLVAADDRDGVTIWDWQRNVKLNRFCNGNPVGTKITEAKFINEDDIAMLMTGSGEGVVNIYRHYDNPDKIRLACSWRALTDMLPSSRSSGLVAEWQQGRGTLFVGGDVKVIRMWDATRELCISDIPARSSSPITSLTSDQVAGNILVSGFGDGAVRVYDRRLDSRDSMVRVWKHHRSWIINLHMQRGGFRELVSGSVNGLINLWDIRMDQPVVEFEARPNGMRSMYVHEHAPIIATGASSVKMFTTSGHCTSTIKNSNSYMLHNRQIFTSALCFHPHRMVLAVNNAHDAHISLYNCHSNMKHSF